MEYDVLDEVNRDKTVIWVVRVYYDVVFEVNRDQTMFFVVHVGYDVLYEVNRDQIEGDLLGSPRVLRRRLRGQS